MIDPEKTNEYVVKLSGKASIPTSLKIGENYAIKANGTVTSITESDNEDGSHVFYNKFEPVTIEIIDDLGKSIKAKDTRKKSQLFRSRIWAQWNKTNGELDFDQYYDRVMDNLIQMAEEIVEMYGPESTKP